MSNKGLGSRVMIPTSGTFCAPCSKRLLPFPHNEIWNFFKSSFSLKDLEHFKKLRKKFYGLCTELIVQLYKFNVSYITKCVGSQLLPQKKEGAKQQKKKYEKCGS
jgi:hypothetical protein